MPIIVSRKTGAIISDPGYTQEQKEKAWELIVKKWCIDNKEYLHALAEKDASRSNNGTVEN